MTKKKLDFEKLEAAIESCKTYQKNVEAREEQYSKMLDYKHKIETIQDELKKPVEKPDEIDDFGILSVINCWCYNCRNDNMEYDYWEARITNIVDDNLIVRTDRGNSYTVPINEIREKGYYYNEENSLIFVDRIDNSARFKEVIDIIVKLRKRCLLGDIENLKKWIKEHQDSLKTLEEMLPQFDDYKIGNVSKIAQHINFPLDLNYKDIEEFENDFPRVYKI